MNHNCDNIWILRKNQNSEARIKTIYDLFELYCRGFKFSIETLLEEIKRVVTEKNEFEFRIKWIKNTLRFLGLSGLWCKKPADWNFNQIFFLIVRFLVVALMKDIKPVVTKNTNSIIEIIQFQQHFSRNYGLSHFDARININGVPIDYVCNIQGSSGSAIKFARHGQFQDTEKNSDHWTEYFLFQKIFRRKKIIEIK